MQQYYVRLTLIERYGIEVNAISEEDAREKAWDMFNNATDDEKSNTFWYESDSDSEAEEI